MSNFKVGDKVFAAKDYYFGPGTVVNIDSAGDIEVLHDDGNRTSHYAKYFVTESVYNSELYQLLHKEDECL